MSRLLPIALLALILTSGIAQAQETVPVRITFYVDHGVTYSGSWTRPGVAACSWGWALGARLRLPDGQVVTCEDRGRLPNGLGWVDVWVPSVAAGRATVAARYGDYTVVEVVDRLAAADEEEDS